MIYLDTRASRSLLLLINSDAMHNNQLVINKTIINKVIKVSVIDFVDGAVSVAWSCNYVGDGLIKKNDSERSQSLHRWMSLCNGDQDIGDNFFCSGIICLNCMGSKIELLNFEAAGFADLDGLIAAYAGGIYLGTCRRDR